MRMTRWFFLSSSSSSSLISLRQEKKQKQKQKNCRLCASARIRKDMEQPWGEKPNTKKGFVIRWCLLTLVLLFFSFAFCFSWKASRRRNDEEENARRLPNSSLHRCKNRIINIDKVCWGEDPIFLVHGERRISNIILSFSPTEDPHQLITRLSFVFLA